MAHYVLCCAVPVSMPIIMIATKVAMQTAYSVPIILAAAITSHSHIRSVDISTSIDPKNICSRVRHGEARVK
jgi:hypothetical protein